MSEWQSDEFGYSVRAPKSAPASPRKVDEWGDAEDQEGEGVTAEALRAKIEEKVDNLDGKMDAIIDDFNDQYTAKYKEEVRKLKGTLNDIKSQLFRLNINDKDVLDKLGKIDLKAMEDAVANPLLAENDPEELKRRVDDLAQNAKNHYYSETGSLIDQFISQNYSHVDGLNNIITRSLKVIAERIRKSDPQYQELNALYAEAQTSGDIAKYQELHKKLPRLDYSRALNAFQNCLETSSQEFWDHYIILCKKAKALMSKLGDSEKTDSIGNMLDRVWDKIVSKSYKGEALSIRDIEAYERELTSYQ